jgi:hypothetical protein
MCHRLSVRSISRSIFECVQRCICIFISSTVGVMFSFKLDMIQSEPANDQRHDEQSKRQRQHVIGVVRPGGDVQKEHQVNSHLHDGEHGEAERDAQWRANLSLFGPTWSSLDVPGEYVRHFVEVHIFSLRPKAPMLPLQNRVALSPLRTLLTNCGG